MIRHKRKWGWYGAFLICMFSMGVGVIVYSQLTAQRQTKQMNGIVASIKEELLYIDGGESQASQPEEKMPDYAALRSAMEEYNRRIFTEEQKGLCNEWSYQAQAIDLTEYGWNLEAVGVISIPKIQVEMPLYLGATYEHLVAGLAQLTQTSMPIGGTNSNCVVAGHRGWRGAPYLRDIHKLSIGDEVILQNIWETLQYRVKEIKDIAPNAISEVKIRDGEDLLTLLSCHPYGSGGKQRRVIYCERIEKDSLHSEESLFKWIMFRDL